MAGESPFPFHAGASKKNCGGSWSFAQTIDDRIIVCLSQRGHSELVFTYSSTLSLCYSPLLSQSNSRNPHRIRNTRLFVCPHFAKARSALIIVTFTRSKKSTICGNERNHSSYHQRCASATEASRIQLIRNQSQMAGFVRYQTNGQAKR